jgi:tetratricopeptide (TPR) repeat protein
VATDLNNLARLLQDTNRLAEAEPLVRRALKIDEASLGPDHPDVGRDLNNLAFLLKATNRFAEAEPLYRRALAILEASLPDHHPWVQGGHHNLKVLLESIAAARAQTSADHLTQPRGGHPHPQEERETPPRWGLLSRILGRQ